MLKKTIFLSAILAIIGIFLILDLIILKGNLSINKFAIKQFRLPEIYVLTIGTIAATFATYVIHMLTKNNVADIGTIGVSAINMLAFIICYGFTTVQTYIWLRKYVMFIIYFAASMGILFLIFLLTFKYKKSMNKIIIVGIVFSLFISAISFLFISKMSATRQVYVTETSVGEIKVVVNLYKQPFIYASYVMLGLSLILYLIYFKSMKLIYIDETKAFTLGVKIKRVRFIQMVIISLCASVAFINLGATAFIGFIAANISYLFFREITITRIGVAIMIALALMYIIYFINKSWLGWGFPIGIVANIISIPYLIIIIFKRKKS